MYATNDVQALQDKIQAYSDRLRAELFKAAKRKSLIAFYNVPANLVALWQRIDEANRWTCNEGVIANEFD